MKLIDPSSSSGATSTPSPATMKIVSPATTCWLASAAASTTKPLTSTTAILSVGSDQHYQLRPFDLDQDTHALQDICKDVYGGRDYLPQTAIKYARDPHACFLALAPLAFDNETRVERDPTRQGPIVAVANAQQHVLPNIAWLEAVRTCPTQRGKGLARILTQQLMDISRSQFDCHNVYTCTVDSNVAMKKIFAKVGMTHLGNIHQVKFDRLMELPGWASGNNKNDEDADVRPQPLLQALQLESRVTSHAKQMEWVPVTSMEELHAVLHQIRTEGGMGYLPALYKVLSTPKTVEAIQVGLVWKLRTTDTPRSAVIAFSRDDQIQSLESKWVCSIAATTCVAVESALWHACGADPDGDAEDSIFSSLATATQKDPSSCEECISLPATFTISVDGAVPVHRESSSKLCQGIPFVDAQDACVLYGTTN